MSTHAYTEDQLVEQPAIGLFAGFVFTCVLAGECAMAKDRSIDSRL